MSSEPVTAEAVLFTDSRGNPASSLSVNLREKGVYASLEREIGTLSPSGIAELRRRIDEQTALALRGNLLDIAVEGWRKWQYLQAAARKSLTSPNDMEVPLASHRIRSVQNAFVDVSLNRIALATIAVTTTATFDITIAEAWLRAGRLIALGTGPCDLCVNLELHTFLSRTRVEANPPITLEKHRTIDLQSRIPLGKAGIPLLPPPPGAEDEAERGSAVGD
jgi:hypothetical protein